MKNQFEETHITNVLLSAVQSQVGNQLDWFHLSHMSESMKATFYVDIANQMATAIIRWCNVSCKNEPVIVKRSVFTEVPLNWFEHMKHDYKWLQRIFGKVKLKRFDYDFEFTFTPESIYIDCPSIQELQQSQHVIRRIPQPTVITLDRWME